MGEEDEDVEAELEKMSSMPRQAAFVPVNTGSGNDESSVCRRPCSSTSTTSSNEEPNSQYCPRHHQQQNRHTPSPSKRHRLTPRPHNIQRPCLDFEKMQQIKKRVVTSWRPQGAELSLFCW